jgi:hypothetical protein
MNSIPKIVSMNIVLWSFVFLCVVFVWCLTRVAGNEHSMSLLVICVGLLAALLLAAIVVVPFWVILKRLGSHPALSILMLVPLANLLRLYLVAFSKPNSSQRILRVNNRPLGIMPNRTIFEAHEFHLPPHSSPRNFTPSALRASSNNCAIPIESSCGITELSRRPSRTRWQKWSVS